MGAKIVRYPSPFRKDLIRKLVKVFLAACIMVSLYLLLGQTMVYMQVKKEIRAFQSTLEELKAENERLKEEIVLLQDKEYLEMQARKHLGMVRPGEIIFYVRGNSR